MNNICYIKNYKKTIEKYDVEIYVKYYIELINEYMVFIVDNMIIQDEVYLLFLIKRGVETITHCFKTLLMYTKNIDLTMFHSKKALYYYIEFIGQISDIQTKHSYLQLNSKDAILFVYKKTIYDINNVYCKTFYLIDKEKKLLLNISNSMILFNDMLLFILQKEGLNVENKKKNIYFAIQKTTKIINKIFKKKRENSESKIKICLFFFQIIQMYSIDTNKYSNICELFINKLHKYPIKNDFQKLKNILKNKIYSGICEKKILDMSPLRFINWLINPL